VAKAISLCKATVRNIKLDLFWAFAYNVLLIPVAAGILYPLFAGPPDVPMLLQPFLGKYGFLYPILAAAAMTLSRVTVFANSLRLRRLIPVVGMGKIPKMGTAPPSEFEEVSKP
jgi:P-type Cu+ transporter